MSNHLLASILAASTTPTTVKAATKSSSTQLLLIVLILLAVVYFFFIRPRQRKARAARGGAKPLELGDEVVTIGGILGTVSALEGDVIIVEVGPDNHMSFLRRAVNPRTPADMPVSNPVTVPDDEDDGATYDDDDPDWDESAADVTEDADVTDDADTEDTEDHDTGDDDTGDDDTGDLDTGVDGATDGKAEGR